MCEVYFFDGPDYAGKTTLINRLSSHFLLNGKRVAKLKEPDGDIRKILLDKDGDYDFASRRCLFAANHFQTLSTIYKIKDYYDYIFVDRCAVISDIIYSFDEITKNPRTRNLLYSIINQYNAVDNYEYDKFFKNNSNLVLLNLSEQELRKRISSRPIKEDDLFDIKSDGFKIKIAKKYEKMSKDIMVKNNKIRDLFNEVLSIEVDDNLRNNIINFIERCI